MDVLQALAQAEFAVRQFLLLCLVWGTPFETKPSPVLVQDLFTHGLLASTCAGGVCGTPFPSPPACLGAYGLRLRVLGFGVCLLLPCLLWGLLFEALTPPFPNVSMALSCSFLVEDPGPTTMLTDWRNRVTQLCVTLSFFFLVQLISVYPGLSSLSCLSRAVFVCLPVGR